MNKPIILSTKLKLRGKFLLCILLLGLSSLGLFYILWINQGNAARICENIGLIDWFDETAFREKARQLAKDYEVPPFYESDEGMDDPTVIAFRPYLNNLADEFTGVYIYGLDDGLYRAGKAADLVNRSWFNTIWTLEFKMLGEETAEFPAEFANGTYTVLYYSYHRVLFAYPYTIGSAFFCLLLFFSGILLFVKRMVRRIQNIEASILRMSSGDLQTAVPACGNDEIGIVARELDTLRDTLQTSIHQEHESLQANQDLITALSHDLRTPLTVLTGYLELLKRLPNTTSKQAATIEHCLQKASDLRILSNKMFDAAQVDAQPAAPVLKKLPLSTFLTCINDNIDFIRIAGFQVNTHLDPCDGMLFGDAIMLKRIADNLFSNILKYGAKEVPVEIDIHCDATALHILLNNAIQTTSINQSSSQIGLRNVEKMLSYHHGSLHTSIEAQHFIAEMLLPLDIK